MAIQDQKISNLKSFEKLTGEPHQVAGLYFYTVLDCLVDLTHKVSLDFYQRPHLYTDLSENNDSKTKNLSIAQLLATLHGRYGSNEKFLNKLQRHQIFSALFGPSYGYSPEGDSNFARLRNELVNACAAFSERVYDTGVEMLRERVREAHRPFQEYLIGLQGDSVRWSKEQALSELTEQVSFKILRNKGVAAVFGISSGVKTDWPYIEDSNADKLVEEIYKQLKTSSEESVNEDKPKHVPLTRERFSNFQRTALRGAEAISAIIGFDERGSDEDLDLLILKCYSWGSALMSLGNYNNDI